MDHGISYHLVMTNSLPWKITMFRFGKPSINGSFSMAMLNNQRVTSLGGTSTAGDWGMALRWAHEK